jgi:hypothetical protein
MAKVFDATTNQVIEVPDDQLAGQTLAFDSLGSMADPEEQRRLQEEQRLTDAHQRDVEVARQIRQSEGIDQNNPWVNAFGAMGQGIRSVGPSMMRGIGEGLYWASDKLFEHPAEYEWMRGESAQDLQRQIQRRKMAYDDPEIDFEQGMWQGDLATTARGLIQESGPTVGMAIAAAPFAAVAPAAGYAKAIQALPKFLQAGAAAAPLAAGMRTVEGLMEGGFVAQEARTRGKTESEISEAALKTTVANMPLMVVDVAQAAAFLGGLPKPARMAMSNISREFIGKLPMKVLKRIAAIGASMGSEGMEEAVQEEISNWALGEGFDPKVVYNPIYAREKHPASFNIGALTGLASGGAHLAFDTVVNNELDRVNPEQLEELFKEGYITDKAQQDEIKQRLFAASKKEAAEKLEAGGAGAGALGLGDLDPITEMTDEVVAAMDAFAEYDAEGLAVEAAQQIAAGNENDPAVIAWRGRMGQQQDAKAQIKGTSGIPLSRNDQDLLNYQQKKEIEAQRQAEANQYVTDTFAEGQRQDIAAERRSFAKKNQAARRQILEQAVENESGVVGGTQTKSAEVSQPLALPAGERATAALPSGETAAGALPAGEQAPLLPKRSTTGVDHVPGYMERLPANAAGPSAETVEAPATDEDSPFRMDVVRSVFKWADNVRPTKTGAEVEINGKVSTIEGVDFLDARDYKSAVDKHQTGGLKGLPGVFIPTGDGTFNIKVARGFDWATGANKQTLTHESFHAAKALGVLSNAEVASVFQPFVRQAAKEMGFKKISAKTLLEMDPNATHGDFTAQQILDKVEELAADDYGNWAPKHPGIINKIWNWLKKLATADVRDLRDLNRAESIYDDVRSGQNTAPVQDTGPQAAPRREKVQAPQKGTKSDSRASERALKKMAKKGRESLRKSEAVMAQVRKAVDGVEAAIWTPGKIYTGQFHYEAIEEAVDDGAIPSNLDGYGAVWMDGFQFPDGEFLNRDETLKRIGVETSEELAAVKAGKTVEEAYDGFEESNPEVSDEEIDAFTSAAKAQVRGIDAELKAEKIAARDRRYGVGKKMGHQTWVHRDYEDVFPGDLESAKKALGDVDYDVVRYDHKTGAYAFIGSQDFNTNPEPTVEDSHVVTADGNVKVNKQPKDPLIYHHKWQFVKDDYAGFDVEESKRRSLEWKKLIGVNKDVSNRIGRLSYWQREIVPQLGAKAQVRYEFRDDAQQDIESAKTSRKQIPSTFLRVKRNFGWEPGTLNADIGGGAWELFTNRLKDEGVENIVWDRFARSKEHNDAVLPKIINGQADTATVNNVLNVIKERESQLQVIKNAHNVLKDGGTAYFVVYEKDKDGVGKPTKDGWQRNEKTSEYLPLIQEIFPDAYLIKKDLLIVAPKPATGGAKAQVRDNGTPPKVLRVTQAQWNEAERKADKDLSEFPADQVENMAPNDYADLRRTWTHMHLGVPASMNQANQRQKRVRVEVIDEARTVSLYSYRDDIKSQIRSKEFKEWFDGADPLMSDENGMPVMLFHGSFHDIENIDLSKINYDNYFGRAFYTTTSPSDASTNYATESAGDRTSRVGQAYDQVMYDVEAMVDDGLSFDEMFKSLSDIHGFELTPADRKLAKKYDVLVKKYNDGTATEDEIAAHDSLEDAVATWASNRMVLGEGAARVYMLNMAAKNAVHMAATATDTDQTTWNFEFDQDGNIDGEVEKIFDGLWDAVADLGGNPEEILGEVYAQLGENSYGFYDGEITAKDFFDALKNSEMVQYFMLEGDAYSALGDQLGSVGELARRAFDNAGYDAVVMDAGVFGTA